MNAQHSAKSCEHGSPTEALELARYTLGRIDLDPASSSYWNTHTVRATRYFDRRANGLKQAWAGLVWLNPPGADEDAGTDSLVRPFWERLVEQWRGGAIEGAVYHGYSLEQLSMLQSSPMSPLRCITLVYARRLRHLRATRGGPPVPGDSPTHASFTTLLTNRRFDSIARQQIARFVERGSRLGQLLRPL